MNTWTGRGLADGYAHHSATLRGAVRHALVTRALRHHLPAGGRLLDVGGGSGVQAIAVARAGHGVVVVDPDPAMLALAAAAIDAEPPQVQRRVELVHGRGEDAADVVGGGFDAVLCHGVLPYVDDPDALLAALVTAARPAGLVSVLAKNAAALAMRPGLEGRHADALAVLDTDRETGRLGVASRADDRSHLTARLAAFGAVEVGWYGVRVFTDHLGDAPVPADWDNVVELEWRAGLRDPYRQVARLFHLLARRRG